MLRRKPTALTITSDDIAAFEEQLAHRQAYTHYARTGEDPQNLFTQPTRCLENPYETQTQSQGYSNQRPVSSGGIVDPNDELKPLPGAKASIVRAKDERIIGSGSEHFPGWDWSEWVVLDRKGQPQHPDLDEAERAVIFDWQTESCGLGMQVDYVL